MGEEDAGDHREGGDEDLGGCDHGDVAAEDECGDATEEQRDEGGQRGSSVEPATWATFIPFALGFGAITERWNVHIAGWLLVALAVAIAALLAVITRRSPAADVTCPNDLTIKTLSVETTGAAA